MRWLTLRRKISLLNHDLSGKPLGVKTVTHVESHAFTPKRTIKIRGFRSELDRETGDLGLSLNHGEVHSCRDLVARIDLATSHPTHNVLVYITEASHVTDLPGANQHLGGSLEPGREQHGLRTQATYFDETGSEL